MTGTRRSAAGIILALLLLTVPAKAVDWNQYQVLLWQERTPTQLATLKSLGFTGAKLRATGGIVDAPHQAALQAAGLPFYLENAATDFYSPYHRYAEGKSVTWWFDVAKAQYRAGDPAAFTRDPSLSDPAWIGRVQTRLQTLAQSQAENHPIFLNLADESGIADLAAAWDFDQSPPSLAAMRVWLQTQYPSLDGLNQQWGSSFTTWDEVMPETTDQVLKRTDQNLSAWSDFKAWMDVAFTQAVRLGTDAVHQADPAALAGLEGGQIPGWGGYDYARLAPAVDVMEIYDDGNALDLATAFNPALIPLRTSFARGPNEDHAAWHSLLHGGRGMVVWDEADDIVNADGTPGLRGLEIATLVKALNAAAPLLHNPAPDTGVAVLISQESFRVTWLLDRLAGDHDWEARDAEREYDDNAWRQSRRILLSRLAQLAVQPRLISTQMLEAGDLQQQGVRLLLLPQCIALSDAELAAIAAFRTAGGTVLATTEPGLYDGHGRRRPSPPLPDIPHPQPIRPDSETTEPSTLAALATLLTTAGVAPRVSLLSAPGIPATGLEGRWFRTGSGLILALHPIRPFSLAPGITIKLPDQPAATPLPPLTVAPLLIRLDG